MHNIKIDPVEYDLLLHTLEKQRKELVRLKNRAAFEEPKGNNRRKDIDLSISVDKWNCQYFIRYFLQQYKEAYDEDYTMQPSAWKLEAYKITHFWRRHKDLTKEQFKEFISWLFETAAENYKIKMGLMTNDNQLENFKKYTAKYKKDVYNITEKKIEEDIKKQPEVNMTAKELEEKMRKSLGE